MSDGSVLPLAEVIAAVRREVAAAERAGEGAAEVEVDLAVEVVRGPGGRVDIGVLAGGAVRGLLPARHRVVVRVRQVDAGPPAEGATGDASSAGPAEGVPAAAAVAAAPDEVARADQLTVADQVAVAVARVDTPQQATALASALRHGTAPSRRWAPAGVASFVPGTATLTDPAAVGDAYRSAGGGAVVMCAAVLASADDARTLERAAALVEALGPAAAFDPRGTVAPLSAPPPGAAGARLFLVTF